MCVSDDQKNLKLRVRVYVDTFETDLLAIFSNMKTKNGLQSLQSL